MSPCLNPWVSLPVGEAPRHLEGLDGLIIPGGESTTIGKLAAAYNLMDPLRAFGKHTPFGEPVPVQFSFRRTPSETSRFWN